MAKFTQYYIEYKINDMFAQQEKAERQHHLANLFEKKESIDFVIGEAYKLKIYKHEVYHLKLNHDIIVMRIANEKTKEVVQDFKKKVVKHEPPCYVLIDNRQGCRRIAIQKCKESFSRTGSLANIIKKVLNYKMMQEHSIGIDIHPQYYPKDFYKAWSMHQYHAARIHFGLTEGSIPSSWDVAEQDDDSIMGFAIKVNEDSLRKKYKTELVLSPAQEDVPLLVDKDSLYIRNLVNFHAATGSPITIETSDGARFSCFLDDEEDSNNIVTSEIDTKWLDALFGENDEDLAKAEEQLLAFVNGMKYTVDEDEKQLTSNQKEGAA